MPKFLYHYTRLLPEEVEEIRSNGLSPLSPTLLSSKIDKANLFGANLTCRDIKTKAWNLRNGLICFISCDYQSILNNLCSGLGYSSICELIENWGGEIIQDPMKRLGHQSIYLNINNASKAYMIRVSLDGFDIDVYEGFKSIPMSPIIITSDREYQIKQLIPARALTIDEIIPKP